MDATCELLPRIVMSQVYGRGEFSHVEETYGIAYQWPLPQVHGHETINRPYLYRSMPQVGAYKFRGG